MSTVKVPKTNRAYRDTLFRFLFADKEQKGNALSLYNALSGEHRTDPAELEITTIDDFIYLNMKNDVSFLVGSDLFLVEQQSTWNPNMPLRGLFYLSGLLQAEVEKEDLNLYSRSQLMLPTPQYVVLYNGKQVSWDRRELHLTASFRQPGKSCIEVTVPVLNINAGQNMTLKHACQPLLDYSCFVEEVRKQTEKTPDLHQAIALAVDVCIEKGILADILRKHKQEVIGMCYTEFDEAAVRKADREEGRKVGAREGRKQNALCNAGAMFRLGFAFDLVRQIIGPVLTDEELRQLERENRGC